MTSAIAGGLALAAVACGKGKGAAAPQAGGPPYAGVFVDRPAATYRYVSSTSMYDPDAPEADANGNVVTRSEATVSCKTTTRRVDAWQLADIECTGAEGADILDDLAGTFAAGPKGIWRVPQGEDSADFLAGIEQEPPLLVASPTPVDDKKEGEGEEAGFGELHKVSAQAGGWCVERGSWGGDESGSGICFDPARGITKVTRYWAGGSVHDSSLELVE